MMVPPPSPEEVAVNLSEKVEELFSRQCPETEQEVHGDNEVYEGTTVEELGGLIEQINKEVKWAEEHVRMHVSQREEANYWIKIAEEDYVDEKTLIEATKTVTVDMGQNENIPSLGADQCGDFYYTSPKIQFICGLVENVRHFMDVSIWGEGTAN